MDAPLSQSLHETSGRHGAFEAAAPPHDWWVVRGLHGRAPGRLHAGRGLRGAGRYMADGKNVVAG